MEPHNLTNIKDQLALRWW